MEIALLSIMLKIYERILKKVQFKIEAQLEEPPRGFRSVRTVQHHIYTFMQIIAGKNTKKIWKSFRKPNV